ncbi:MAG: TIR domain-containing protein, partial [Anaerolineaceae bacterium]|nr:TIR domain-containing protein [Anaerolineaceae bacterium]
MSYDAFISYSSKDKIVADAVVAALEKKEIRCWYAPRDIEPGTDWGESITHAISDSTLMLLIFSKNSNQSKRVLDEIYYAISEEKTILPFRIENLDPSGAMRLHLLSRHWLDAYDPSWEAHINRLVNSVSVNLGFGAGSTDIPLPISIPAPETLTKAVTPKALPWKLIGIVLALAVIVVCIFGGIWIKDRIGQASVEPTASLSKIVLEISQTPTMAVTATEESEIVATVAATEEDAIKVVINGSIIAAEISLDPKYFYNQVSYEIIENIFVNLTNYDLENTEIIPEGAESWTVSPDGKFYTFKIRPDIPWVIHTPGGETTQALDEEGNPRYVTAHDFEYAIKRFCFLSEMINIETIIAPVIKGCQDVLSYENQAAIPTELIKNIGVQAFSDDELTIELVNPAGYFLSMTGMQAFAALPEWAIEDYVGAWTSPGIIPTNGYFVSDQWDIGE